VVFFGLGNVPTAWYFFLEMFRQGGIFWSWECSDCMVFLFRNVPTGWYFLVLGMFRLHGISFYKCSDSVVFFGLGNVPTAWYFFLEMFRQRGNFWFFIFIIECIMIFSWCGFVIVQKPQTNVFTILFS
jgi:hypothetical protein